MRRRNRFTFWQITLFCFLACAIPLILRSAQAQTGQRAEEKFPSVPEGYTIIEGDIQMPIEVVNAMRSEARLKPNTPQATFNTQLWPNGVVPFEFDSNCAMGSTTCVSIDNQTSMLNAMATLETIANVDFQQCANNVCSGAYVHIQASNANNSPVGRQGGRQIINITSWGSPFIIAHELLHTLGFLHEQTRPDRNTYVDVTAFCNNVQGGCMGSTYLNNFPISNGATTYGYYDFDSVMHYGQCSFSRNDGTVRDSDGALVPACPADSSVFPDGGITIQVREPYRTQWQNAIGQRTHLSNLDQATLAIMYPRSNWRFVDQTYNGGNGPSDGSFQRPFREFITGFTNTPAGGALWIQPGAYAATGAYNKQVTIRAPLGGVILQ